MSNRKRQADESEGNDAQRSRLTLTPRRLRSNTRQLRTNPTQIDLDAENRLRRQIRATARAATARAATARTATTTSTTLSGTNTNVSRRLLSPATTSSSSGGSHSSLAPLRLATSTTSSYGLPTAYWPLSATSRSATSVTSSEFAAMPARSSTSVVNEWFPPSSSSSYSPLHSATLTTSSAPSASSSARVANRRLTSGENEYFMLRSPGGTAFLNSYAEAEKSKIEVCSICTEDIFDLEVIVPFCGHLFHDVCLRAWHNKHPDRENTCPMCQQIVNKVAANINSARDYTVQQYPWSMFRHPRPQ